ncbi:MAG TPA: cation:proton antiporter [Gemmatimonadales bacterium]|jgi:NhaP-type Na+/H+ or K+/H+ antiporter|nr:cation:proton antiporter [Gemmatimonadales bacterium]
MQSFDPAAFAHLLALLGLVILVASLASGAIERLGVPTVAVFLALGALLGPHGLGLLDFGLGSATLAVVATLSLVLVLFTDSVTLNLAALRTQLRLAATVLGPGTILPALLTGLAGWWLLDLSPAAAAILGAALASTDPVMVRGLLRLAEVPGAARTALGIESGLNDALLLPIVLLASALLAAGGMPPLGEIGKVAGAVLLLGPLAGVVVGFLAVKAMEWFRAWFGMRRDYESLYVLGVAFTAYAAAEALHGSGFMAAFAAGLTIAATDVELCDCFHEYGEATAEMLLLLGFIAFGASLVWSGLTVLSGRSALFAAVALGGRVLVLQLALPRRGLDPVARRLIVWYGPRALSSFLLVLIPVFLGIPGSEQLFPLAALVVLLSVAGHGALLVWATHWLKRRPETMEAPAGGLPGAELVAHPELITFEELDALQRAGYAVHLLDVRTDRSWEGSESMAAGAIRLPPARPAQSAAALALPRQDWLVAYCA